MKAIAVADLQADTDAVLDSAQTQRIVITRNGKPSAVIVGIESYDAEDLRLASSPEFWQMIEERRRGKAIPLSEVKTRLEAKERTPATLKGNRVRVPRRSKTPKAKR